MQPTAASLPTALTHWDPIGPNGRSLSPQALEAVLYRSPITFNPPKPLVRVHGKRIIDGLLDTCLDAGINEIYIVRGYLAEQFDQLLYKYPMIRFLENPVYNEANNISSAMVAHYMLSNAYVFEADLLISIPKIIRKYHYTSDFLAIKKDHTDDRCFTVKDGVITEGRRSGLLAGGRHLLLERY